MPTVCNICMVGKLVIGRTSRRPHPSLGEIQSLMSRV